MKAKEVTGLILDPSLNKGVAGIDIFSHWRTGGYRTGTANYPNSGDRCSGVQKTEIPETNIVTALDLDDAVGSGAEMPRAALEIDIAGLGAEVPRAAVDIDTLAGVMVKAGRASNGGYCTWRRQGRQGDPRSLEHQLVSARR